jgi:hypothetical protein
VLARDAVFADGGGNLAVHQLAERRVVFHPRQDLADPGVAASFSLARTSAGWLIVALLGIW